MFYEKNIVFQNIVFFVFLEMMLWIYTFVLFDPITPYATVSFYKLLEFWMYFQ